jgi:riboflavin kinase / FMN adenylyltransferase
VGWDELVLGGRSHGDAEAGAEGGGGVLACGGEDDESDLVVLGERVVLGDALQDELCGFEGGLAVAELLDGEEGAADAHDEFAVAGGGGGTVFGVDVEAVTDDGGVTDAAGEFEGESAGGAAAGEDGVVVEAEDADGVVVGFASVAEFLDVGHGGGEGVVAAEDVVFGPLFPCGFGGLGKEEGWGDEVGVREVVGVWADEEDVGSGLHDFAGDGDGVWVSADGSDGAASSGREHEGGVEGDATGGVWESAYADCGVGGVGLGVAAGGLDGVECAAAGGEGGEAGAVGLLAEGPGGEENRWHRCVGWSVGYPTLRARTMGKEQAMDGDDGLAALRAMGPGAVVTIGNFDGVHLGHRELLRRARLAAGERGGGGAGGGGGGGGGRVVAVTFEPHPATVIRPGSAPLRLTPLDLRKRLLLEAGADEVIVVPPTPAVLGIEAEDFFAILRDESRVSHLVEGENFCFGRNRRGTMDRLGEWTKSAGIGLTVVGAVEVALLDMTVVGVSSSLIRTLAGYGRVREAGICLGSPLPLVGRVVEGFRRGRTIGFPTANLSCDGNVVPGDGVYAARARVDGVVYPVALNVGPMPTFGETPRQIEAHLVGFAGDLYGRELELEVVDFLRDIRRFPGVEALKGQLRRDVGLAVELSGRALHQPIGDLAGVGK